MSQTFSRLVGIRSVSPRMVVFSGLASCVLLVVSSIQHLPLWGTALAVLAPWVPLFTAETTWMHRHYGSLALFYVLVVTQIGHCFEHVAQMTQIHIFHLTGANARGIFGALDIEWVHFVWNTWVLIAVVLLLRGFRKNPWLWVTVALASWHELEHLFVFYIYLATGRAGTPGLLAQGGLIGGGLPIQRPDLHFFYNIIETVPLVVGFVWQLQRAYHGGIQERRPRLSQVATH